MVSEWTGGGKLGKGEWGKGEGRRAKEGKDKGVGITYVAALKAGQKNQSSVASKASVVLTVLLLLSAMKAEPSWALVPRIVGCSVNR